MKDLILLHGALGHPDQFNLLIAPLKEYFTIHTLLFLGHGDHHREENFTIDDLVEQLNEFIFQKKIEQPLVFGYSMGGFVALSHALKYPKVIASIMTLATKFKWNEEIALKETHFLNPSVIEDKVPKYAQQLANIHGDSSWKNLLLQTAEMMLDIGRYSSLKEAALSKIEIPVQVMVGDQDKMVSIEETEWAFKQLPNSRMVVLPHTFHPFEKVDLSFMQYLILNYWS